MAQQMKTKEDLCQKEQNVQWHKGLETPIVVKNSEQFGMARA